MQTQISLPSPIGTGNFAEAQLEPMGAEDDGAAFSSLLSELTSALSDPSVPALALVPVPVPVTGWLGVPAGPAVATTDPEDGDAATGGDALSLDSASGLPKPSAVSHGVMDGWEDVPVLALLPGQPPGHSPIANDARISAGAMPDRPPGETAAVSYRVEPDPRGVLQPVIQKTPTTPMASSILRMTGDMPAPTRPAVARTIDGLTFPALSAPASPADAVPGAEAFAEVRPAARTGATADVSGTASNLMEAGPEQPNATSSTLLNQPPTAPESVDPVGDDLLASSASGAEPELADGSLAPPTILVPDAPPDLNPAMAGLPTHVPGHAPLPFGASGRLDPASAPGVRLWQGAFVTDVAPPRDTAKMVEVALVQHGGTPGPTPSPATFEIRPSELPTTIHRVFALPMDDALASVTEGGLALSGALPSASGVLSPPPSLVRRPPSSPSSPRSRTLPPGLSKRWCAAPTARPNLPSRPMNLAG